LGIALAWLTEWQRSIWPAVICHALNNFLAVASVYMLAR
jgi:membrane protease YdiL (CAAX protease family)